MPDAELLNSYYSAAYWEEWGKQEKIKIRDIDHFLFLKKHIPMLDTRSLTFLNFGAGHGGISHLL